MGEYSCLHTAPTVGHGHVTPRGWLASGFKPQSVWQSLVHSVLAQGARGSHLQRRCGVPEGRLPTGAVRPGWLAWEQRAWNPWRIAGALKEPSVSRRSDRPGLSPSRAARTGCGGLVGAAPRECCSGSNLADSKAELVVWSLRCMLSSPRWAMARHERAAEGQPLSDSLQPIYKTPIRLRNSSTCRSERNATVLPQ